MIRVEVAFSFDIDVVAYFVSSCSLFLDKYLLPPFEARPLFDGAWLLLLWTWGVQDVRPYRVTDHIGNQQNLCPKYEQEKDGKEKQVSQVYMVQNRWTAIEKKGEERWTMPRVFLQMKQCMEMISGTFWDVGHWIEDYKLSSWFI